MKHVVKHQKTRELPWNGHDGESPLEVWLSETGNREPCEANPDLVAAPEPHEPSEEERRIKMLVCTPVERFKLFTKQQERVFQLKILDDRSFPEVGKMLHMSPSSVWSVYRTVVKKLQHYCKSGR